MNVANRFFFFFHLADPTRIVTAPENQRVLIGTAAQLSCIAKYDKSFSDDFELLWEKDDVEIALNYTENSRWDFVFLCYANYLKDTVGS